MNRAGEPELYFQMLVEPEPSNFLAAPARIQL